MRCAMRFRARRWLQEKAEPESTALPTPAPAPAQPVAAPEPTGPAIPEVALDASPSENLINLFAASVTALSNATDAKEGAAILTGILAKYNVADLRDKSLAAKEAGNGASDELKAKFATLKETYKEVSTKLGAADPDTFGPVAAEWAKAWGLN
ncbi:MAG: hypothetical protein R3A47_05805 [Polyangiales bacterium]